MWNLNNPYYCTPYFFKSDRAQYLPPTMKNLRNPLIKPEATLDQKNLLGLSLLLILAINFTFSYLGHTYYSDSILDIQGPGYWVFLVNYTIMIALVLLNKNMLDWSWSNLGLGRPKNWWEPVLTAMITFLLLLLFSHYVRPVIIEEFGKHQNISYLFSLRQDLPRLIGSLVTVWITAAFLQEIIFRSFFINALDTILGKSNLSAWTAVIISSLVFGLVHAYQGITGILITTTVGFIFGAAYLYNGRRIWPIIFVHGIVDTLTLTSIYNS